MLGGAKHEHMQANVHARLPYHYRKEKGYESPAYRDEVTRKECPIIDVLILEAVRAIAQAQQSALDKLNICSTVCCIAE